jgi:DNA-binding CsgD family transcriptional regulator
MSNLVPQTVIRTRPCIPLFGMRLGSLTDSELKVVKLIALGATNRSVER